MVVRDSGFDNDSRPLPCGGAYADFCSPLNIAKPVRGELVEFRCTEKIQSCIYAVDVRIIGPALEDQEANAATIDAADPVPHSERMQILD